MKQAAAMGPRQRSILELFWKLGALTPAQVHSELAQRDQIAYTTVHTEISRLLEKGLLRRCKNEAGLYEAVMTRAMYSEKIVSGVLRDLIKAHGAAAIHGFMTLVEDDEDALNEIRRRLRDKK